MIRQMVAKQMELVLEGCLSRIKRNRSQSGCGDTAHRLAGRYFAVRAVSYGWCTDLASIPIRAEINEKHKAPGMLEIAPIATVVRKILVHRLPSHAQHNKQTHGDARNHSAISVTSRNAWSLAGVKQVDNCQRHHPCFGFTTSKERRRPRGKSDVTSERFAAGPKQPPAHPRKPQYTCPAHYRRISGYWRNTSPAPAPETRTIALAAIHPPRSQEPYFTPKC